ncbi:hypothetical protein FQA39_LY10069 [Lamprigera yunnana]|nr:hypothetical protein FQA39_LY10069 [Lamprigera yunnana]
MCENERINYESLIEQVECSSDSDKSEDKYLDTNDNINSSSDEESDSESAMSVTEGNSLESRMLQNMLRETYATDPNADDDVKMEIVHNEIKEYSTSDSEDSSESNETVSDTEADVTNVKSTTDDESSDLSNTSKESEHIKFEPENNIFARKSDELDSAIRSISYQEIHEQQETKTDTFKKLDSSLQNPLQNSSKRTVYVNSNDPSLCEICLKTWPAKKHLWQHYIRCHKTVAATVCGICLKTNDTYKSLQIHLHVNHPTLLHGQGFGSNFICRICGRYHNASSKLKLHMAIHENFDWSILENFENLQKNYDIHEVKKEVDTASNGYLESRVSENMCENERINYESLIEQVECSSDSDKSEDKYLDTNDNINSSSDEESDSESAMSVTEGNSLESRMLQNMLRETYATDPNADDVKMEIVHNEIKEYSTSDSEDSSESNETVSDTEADVTNVKSTTDDESSDLSNTSKESEHIKFEPENNIFVRKSDELDSAIRSISYQEIHEQQETNPIDICDIHPQILNQHELQSAVDSIL